MSTRRMPSRTDDSLRVGVTPMPHGTDDTTPVTARTEVGTWILTEPLGMGAFSEVWGARPKLTAEHHPADYAVKLVRPEYRQNAAVLAAWEREGLLGRTLCNPHLVPILDARVQMGAQSYLVMPRLRGALVRQSLDHVGKFAARQALWITRQAVEALQVLHQAGWLHGDVKPDNLHVTALGHVSLLDLGLAGRLASSSIDVAAPQGGSVAYAAPERLVQHHCIRGQADIYSLGITLYEMLIGSHPFPHLTAGQLTQAHLRQAIIPPDQICPDIGPEVSVLVCEMLRKEPMRRPYPCAELRQRLMHLESSLLSQVPSDGPPFDKEPLDSVARGGFTPPHVSLRSVPTRNATS